MEKIPARLWFRFVLEWAGLVFGGIWGFRLDPGPPKYFFAFGIPLIMAICWGIFNVPDDPARSGQAPVLVPGWFRLLLEIALFGFSAFAAWQSLGAGPGLGYGLCVLVQFWWLRDRVLWLLKAKK